MVEVVDGKGGGTAARILLDVWPSRKLEGWEIDRVVSRRQWSSHLLHVQLHGYVEETLRPLFIIRLLCSVTEETLIAAGGEGEVASGVSSA